MRFVLVFITLFVCMDGLVWLYFDQQLRRLPRSRLLRVILGLCMSAVILFLAANLVTMNFQAHWHEALPRSFTAIIYIWHFLVLPLTVLPMLIARGVIELRRKMAHRPVPPVDWAPAKPSGSMVSRRDFLAAGALAIPPLATFSLTGMAMGQIGEFRVRKFDLPLSGFPRQLDGLTVAVVADIHTGVFTTPKMLRDIRDCTNNLRADMILLGGDLINISHADLPSALDIVAAMDAPAGVFMVEGNHDVIEGPDQFDAGCRARGVRLLLDETITLRPRGVPIQLLGTRWRGRAGQMIDSVNTVADARNPELFSILLAHHPHCWDQADQRGIPLTLSGHTHGGQIMITDKIGAGPLRFRYWSGLYSRRNSKLIVSNGVGNWFPLRINAPAEILHLTLRSA